MRWACFRWACFALLCEGGIIDVALLLPGVEGRLVRRIERGIFPVAGWQIRIGQKLNADCDKVRFTARHSRLSGAGIVAAVDEERVAEALAQDWRCAHGSNRRSRRTGDRF